MENWGRLVSYGLFGLGILILFTYEGIATNLSLPLLLFQVAALLCIIAAFILFQAVRVPPPKRGEAYKEVFSNKEDKK